MHTFTISPIKLCKTTYLSLYPRLRMACLHMTCFKFYILTWGWCSFTTLACHILVLCFYTYGRCQWSPVTWYSMECKHLGFLRYCGSVGGAHRDALSSSRPMPIIIGRRSSLNASRFKDHYATNIRPSTIIRLQHANLSLPVKVGVVNAQSIGNKYAMICDRIATGKLKLCEIVET